MSEYNNSIIFGKNKTERIVAVEVVEPSVELYIQQEDGSIETEYLDHKYWMLCNKKLRNDWSELKGNQHYKYGKQYPTRNDFYKIKFDLEKKGNDIYMIYQAVEAAMVKDGMTLFKGMKFNEISVLSFDIETIGVNIDMNAKVLIIANTYRDHAGKITRRLFSYDEYENPGQMLEAWTEWVREMNPTVICGHNINGFDLPYLETVADLNDVGLYLGRDGSKMIRKQKESKFRKDGSQFIHYNKVEIFGRHVIDTMFLSIKYDVGRKYESYGLKNIIKHEGLEVEGRVFYDASTIKDNYQDPVEFQKIKEYATFDGDDALALFDLQAPPFFYMTQSVPKTFQQMCETASGSQINSIMVRGYLQDKQSVAKGSESYHFEGALSYGKPGIYKNCVRWDVSGLYPSIMRADKVYAPEKDPNKNFIQLTEYFSIERLKNKKLAKETKDKYYDDLQAAQKIFANSLYGFLGAPGLNYNHPPGAEYITKRGREILTKAVEWATSKKFEVWQKEVGMHQDGDTTEVGI